MVVRFVFLQHMAPQTTPIFATDEEVLNERADRLRTRLWASVRALVVQPSLGALRTKYLLRTRHLICTIPTPNTDMSHHRGVLADGMREYR